MIIHTNKRSYSAYASKEDMLTDMLSDVMVDKRRLQARIDTLEEVIDLYLKGELLEKHLYAVLEDL